jgi:type II secretory pathway component PulK
MKRNMPRRENSRSGSTLLVVLVILGVIAVLATAVARSVSGAALELSSARSAAENESDLRAGIELGVGAILKLGDTMRRANASADLSGRRLTVRVTNERARIDLNRAKATVVTGLLKAVNVDDTEAALLASNIVQWRGGGSEESDAPLDNQRSLGVLSQSVTMNTPLGLAANQPAARTPAVRFFSHPIQLAMVPGFSAGIVRRLFPLVTVANGTNTINPFIAPREVLSALPDVSSSAVEAFIGSQGENVGRDTAIQLLGADMTLLSEERAGGWRLEITSKSRLGAARHSEAVVAGVDDSGGEPYRVLYVIDDSDERAWHLR